MNWYLKFIESETIMPTVTANKIISWPGSDLSTVCQSVRKVYNPYQKVCVSISKICLLMHLVKHLYKTTYLQ